MAEQELTEAIVHTLMKSSEEEPKEEKQQQNQPKTPYKLNRMTSMSLRDVTESLQDLEDKDVNENHYRLLGVVVFAVVFLVMGNLTFFGIYSEKSEAVLQIISVIFFSLILISCIYFLIKAYCGDSKKLSNYLMSLLNISQPSDDNVFFFHAFLYNLNLLLYSTIYGCITVLFPEIFYHDIWWDESQCSQEINKKIGCIVVFSTYGKGIPFVFSVFLFYFFKTVKCSSTIVDAKNKITSKYKTAENIDRKIKKQLKEWRKRKKIENHKTQFAALIFVWFAVTIFVQGHVRHNIFSIKYSNATDYLSIILVFVFYFIDSLFYSYLVLMIFLVTEHYAFPSIIMEQFLLPLNVEEADDIMGWWELRKFYIYCIINVYSTQLRWSIFLGITGSLIFSTFSLLTFGSTAAYFNMLGALVAAIATFSLVANAVYFHSIQSQHANTMNKEKIVLNRNKFYNANITDNRNILLTIIDYVMFDAEKNSSPIRVLGVGMDANFMLFLRATTVTFIVLFVATSTGTA